MTHEYVLSVGQVHALHTQYLTHTHTHTHTRGLAQDETYFHISLRNSDIVPKVVKFFTGHFILIQVRK